MSNARDLLAAIERADASHVASLLAASPSFPPEAMDALLTAACLGRSYDVFTSVVDNSAVQNYLATASSTVHHRLLNAAVQGGDLHIMAGLARTTGVAWADVAEDTSNERLTPLLVAAIRGDTEAMHFLLREDVDPNGGRTRDGNAPLAMACAYGFTGAVAMLLDAGASVDLRNDDGATAPDLALIYGHNHIIQLCHQAANHRALQQVDGATLKSTISKLRQPKQYTNYAVRERENVDFSKVQQKISKLKARISGRIDQPAMDSQRGTTSLRP
ncbi:hypothetical protein ACHHYP_08006 [Achlya hypogyna]|uniref:Uncharacterized protein n=1 Tax=Achlya hypogyna TaxID=1202772 RepID=A0A1V9YQA1_ACHHY|nr:hypothetical protein ACHHYP_08006 [Achlya hypogyna]